MRPPPPRRDWALFLDVDGTLVELATTPDAVSVPPSVRDLLGRLHALLGGSVALVSGRPVAQLDRLFAPLTLPSVGLHGFEWRLRAGDDVARAGPPPDLSAARDALERFAARRPGVLLEDKGQSLALHFRNRPAAGDDARAAAREVARGLGDGFHVLRGKMIVEVKPTAVHKGAAVRLAMGTAPFAGRVPVFVGDDVTDEDGFAAANALGGHSIKVGLDGPTAAAGRLRDVGAVHRWLTGVAEALGAGGSP